MMTSVSAALRPVRVNAADAKKITPHRHDLRETRKLSHPAIGSRGLTRRAGPAHLTRRK
jgi:hypothetical protein